jgi:transposase
MGNTILDVARHLHVGWNMVKDIHKKFLKGKYSRPDIKGVRRIGIDEFATRKGHVYKTIVVDLDTGRIIHVGDGKGKDALAGFWKRVKRNNVKIEIVTSDLSAAFIASVMENAPDAIHVYDKFHVTKLVTDAVDKVRRSVYAQETDLEKRKIIKGSRWLLLTKDKDVFDDEKKRRLDNILHTNTPLFHAYYLKEDLDQIWMQKSKEEGEKQLAYWCERARETKLQPFVKVANTLMASRTGILAWYDAPVTNAILEGINNKIKVMKRRAYGYRDDEYFKLLLLGLHDKTNAIRG